MVIGALALVVSAVWFAGSRVFPKPFTPAGATLVPSATVRFGELETTIRLSGATTSERVAQLLAPHLRGRRSRNDRNYQLVLEHLAEPGQQVREGDLVARFESVRMKDYLDYYEDLVDRHRSNTRALAARLKVVVDRHQQSIRVAKARVEKTALDLKTAPVRSAIVAERFRLNNEEAKARLRELQQRSKYVKVSEGAALRRSRLDLRESEVEAERVLRNMDRLQVRAPISGVLIPGITRRAGDPRPFRAGDVLGSGEPYAEIVDLSGIVVDVFVNQVDSAAIRIGARAVVRVDSYPDIELPAHVHSVGTIARARKRGSEYLAQVPVRLRLERTDPRLLPNLTASAEIVLERETEAAIVPRQAVFAGPSGTAYVYVSTAEGWRERAVELGVSNHIDVVVRHGVESGDTVALAPPEAPG